MEKKFGTAPVFFTAISTILGAVLFLRFGYAVGTLGFIGVVFIILLAHTVTIPTSLALSEIATNKRVEGGGEYYIISRSFGLNIGATIGISLFLSQAISVAFYIIAFTEAFSFMFDYLLVNHGIWLPRQIIGIPVMLILSVLIFKKGANMGIKALYIINAILAVSLLLFFIGRPENLGETSHFISNFQFRNSDSFFIVFAIVFPAFTGVTAGVGLSGDLRNPGKSIPLGALSATFVGMVIYFFVAYKLAVSASAEELLADQLIMSKIAVYGSITIPLGLAACTFSSALGSIMVAPRTLQALANDESFPMQKINNWLGLSRESDNEPANASLVTCAIALVFVAIGDVDVVAQIISMFFMVTYGTICLISFLNHFGSSPSYRPSFKSKWIFSLIGFIASVWIMFKISVIYTVIAFTVMIALYLYIDNYHKDRKGLAAIFANSIFQINRRLQVYMQRQRFSKSEKEWRPSAICISKNSFKYDNAFRLINWISYKYGFGTYLHHIDGYYSKETYEQSKLELEKILKNIETENSVYLDTIISPSGTSAVAQAIQIPGIAGMENNMVIFDYDKEDPKELSEIIPNIRLVNAGDFDICILAASRKPFYYKNGIHIWIKSSDADNANLMILLSFIILGHPDWKKSNIKIYELCKEEDIDSVYAKMNDLITTGRLPITHQNVEIVIRESDVPVKEIINKYSSDAALTLIGFMHESIKHSGEEIFSGYDKLGNILFVNSSSQVRID